MHLAHGGAVLRHNGDEYGISFGVPYRPVATIKPLRNLLVVGPVPSKTQSGGMLHKGMGVWRNGDTSVLMFTGQESYSMSVTDRVLTDRARLIDASRSVANPDNLATAWNGHRFGFALRDPKGVITYSLFDAYVRGQLFIGTGLLGNPGLIVAEQKPLIEAVREYALR